MFELGRDLDAKRTTWESIRNEDMLPLYLDGIVFSDESHTKAVPAGGTGQNGSMSRHQWRVSVCPKTGKLRRDGVMPPRRYQIKPKYDSYAQGAYSICMPTINGEQRPMFLETLQ